MTKRILSPRALARHVDLTGRRFGRLFVIGKSSKRGHQRLWSCHCDCGTAKDLPTGELTSGGTKSCGCLARETTAARNRTHGLSHRPEYVVWCGMKERCMNSQQEAYRNYGGRGVTVCARWLGSDGFANFLADMGTRPTARHTIERRDNDRGYSPDNCYWATRKAQRRNQRRGLRLITFNGEALILRDWSDRLGIPYLTLFQRLKRGWPIDKTMTTPVGG